MKTPNKLSVLFEFKSIFFYFLCLIFITYKIFTEPDTFKVVLTCYVGLFIIVMVYQETQQIRLKRIEKQLNRLQNELKKP